MPPLVSIALCTYNTGRFLQPLLESLLQQTWRNIEIVCCDDRSTDYTVKTLEQFRQQYPGVFKIHLNEVNLGYIKNFEKCLSLCSGEFIAIADHDDIWKPEKIEKLMAKIGDAMMVYSDSLYIDADGKESGKKISNIFRLHSNPHPHAFVFYDFIWGHTILLKRELLEYALPIPAKIPYDTWLAYTAASISHINYVDEPLTCWRQHENSFTSLMAEQNRHQKNNSNRQYIEFCSKLNRIKLLKNNNYTANKKFMDNLYSGYENLKSGFSWKLFFLLIANQQHLFPIWRRNYISKLNEFRKMSRRVKDIS